MRQRRVQQVIRMGHIRHAVKNDRMMREFLSKYKPYMEDGHHGQMLLHPVMPLVAVGR